MKSSFAAVCKVPLIVFMMIVSAGAVTVKLHGFVPPGIDAGLVGVEYRRLYAELSPDIANDTSPVHVVFYLTHHSNPESGMLPEWGGGGAIGNDSIIMPVDRQPILGIDIGQILVHELSHIILNRAGRDAVRFPRWFHEGVAMALSGDVSDRDRYALSKAVFSGSLLHLQDVADVNSFPEFRAELAYAQSRETVRWLIDTYGISILSEIVDSSVAYRSFPAGFEKCLGLTQREFDIRAIDHISQSQGRFYWMLDDYLGWLLFAVFSLLSSAVVLFKRSRRKLEDEDETIPDVVENEPEDDDESEEDGEAEFNGYADQIGLEDDEDEYDIEDLRPFDDDDGGEEFCDEVDDWDDEGQDGVSWWEE